MKPPIFVRKPSKEERERLESGLRSKDAFNERGLDALEAASSRPKHIHAAFDRSGAEALRELLHRSPREFGRDTSLWTLEIAAEVAFEEGLTQRRGWGGGDPGGLPRL